MSFEDFFYFQLWQPSCSMEQNHYGHLGFLIDTISIQKSSCCYRASFGSKRPKFRKEMSKIDFQDGGCGGYLGFSIRSVLAIL